MVRVSAGAVVQRGVGTADAERIADELEDGSFPPLLPPSRGYFRMSVKPSNLTVERALARPLYLGCRVEKRAQRRLRPIGRGCLFNAL